MIEPKIVNCIAFHTKTLEKKKILAIDRKIDVTRVLFDATNDKFSQ